MEVPRHPHPRVPGAGVGRVHPHHPPVGRQVVFVLLHRPGFQLLLVEQLALARWFDCGMQVGAGVGPRRPRHHELCALVRGVAGVRKIYRPIAWRSSFG